METIETRPLAGHRHGHDGVVSVRASFRYRRGQQQDVDLLAMLPLEAIVPADGSTACTTSPSD